MKPLLLFFFLLPLTIWAQDAVTCYNKGVKAHNEGDYMTAINWYKKCLEQNADNKDAKQNLGIASYNQSLVYFNKKNYTQSINYAQKCLEINSQNANAYQMIGSSYKAQRNYTEAINAYTKAIEYSKKPADVYAARAWVYNDLHDHKNRLADMKKAVELAPENANYQFLCGKYKQEVNQEEFKTALQNYNKAIELKPNYTEAYTERAAYYMTFGQFAKALPDLEKAKTLGADVEHLIEAAKFEMEAEN